jgi:hypothetical protein
MTVTHFLDIYVILLWRESDNLSLTTISVDILFIHTTKIIFDK